MRGLYIIVSAVLVMTLAFWAYRENYATQQVLREVGGLQRQIGNQREELSVLRAEWAYLNRPDRLRDLAKTNFDRLKLFPLLPEQFGRIDQVAFPIENDILLELENPVDVVGMLDQVAN